MKNLSKLVAALAIVVSGSVAAEAAKVPLDASSTRTAVEAAVPEGVEALRITVFDDNVHVLATASSAAKIAGFLQALDGLDGLEAPDLEFNHALASGGSMISVVIPSS